MRTISNEDYRRIMQALPLLEYREDMTLAERNRVRLARQTMNKLRRQEQQEQRKIKAK